MPLDPDAQAIVEARAARGPAVPMRTMGVAAVREMFGATAALQPAPPPIYAVSEQKVPGPHGVIPIRAYRPGPEDGLPVLVYLHGGGWTFGSLDGVENLCRTISQQAGCVVVSVDYRLAPENKFPIPLHDCYAAVQWTAAGAAQIGGDPSRLAVGGDSAGANMTIAIALRARDEPAGPQIACQLLACPITEYAVPRPSWTGNGNSPTLTSDNMIWLWEQYLRDESDLRDPLAVPSVAGSLSGLPPAFILTAEHDPLRDDGEHFGQLLAAAGVPVRVKRYPGAFHGFYTMAGVLQRTSEAIADSSQYLRNLLNG
jgi:acetyl esterase